MRWALSFICDRIKSFSRGSFCPVNKGKQLRMQKQTQEAKGWWRSNHIVKNVCWKNCLCLQTRACVCLLVSFFCFSLDKCGLLMFWQSGFWPAESSRDLLRATFIFPFFFFFFCLEKSSPLHRAFFGTVSPCFSKYLSAQACVPVFIPNPLSVSVTALRYN